MSSSLVKLCLLFSSAAVLYIALGIPLLQRSSRPRAVATGWDLIAIGASLGLLALSLWLTGTPPLMYALSCAGWLLLGVTGIALHAILQAQRTH